MFEVVFVCAGNRARSPLAEALFRRYTSSVADAVRVSSVGTVDIGPLPALAEAIQAGRSLGVDLSSHRARSLRNVDLSSVDLVVGFEPSHLTAAIDRARVSPARAFLLRELTELLGAAGHEVCPVARARSAVARVSARRTPLRWSTGLTIDDPLGKPPAVMRATASEIDLLVQRLVNGLFGVDDTSPSRLDPGTSAHPVEPASP